MEVRRVSGRTKSLSKSDAVPFEPGLLAWLEVVVSVEVVVVREVDVCDNDGDVKLEMEEKAVEDGDSCAILLFSLLLLLLFIVTIETGGRTCTGCLAALFVVDSPILVMYR